MIVIAVVLNWISETVEFSVRDEIHSGHYKSTSNSKTSHTPSWPRGVTIQWEVIARLRIAWVPTVSFQCPPIEDVCRHTLSSPCPYQLHSWNDDTWFWCAWFWVASWVTSLVRSFLDCLRMLYIGMMVSCIQNSWSSLITPWTISSIPTLFSMLVIGKYIRLRWCSMRSLFAI